MKIEKMIFRSILDLCVLSFIVVVIYVLVGYDRNSGREGSGTVPLREILDKMGSISINGNLVENYIVGSFEDLGWESRVFHVLDVDFMGTTSSAWDVTGVDSYVVNISDRYVKWKSLAGRIVMFNVDFCSNNESFSKDREYRLIKERNGRYEIADNHGRSWKYVDGAIVSAVGLSGTLYGFDTQSIRIIRVFEDCNFDRDILRLEFDAGNRVVAVYADGRDLLKVSWSEGKRIVGIWRVPNIRRIIRYNRDNLVRTIRDESGVVRKFEWTANSNFNNPSTPWPFGFHLSSDSDHRYSYEVTSRGYRIYSRDFEGKVMYRVLWNPLEGTVVFYSHSKGSIVSRGVYPTGAGI